MGRLLILLGVVSLVAVGYALMPAEYVPPPEAPAKSAAENENPSPAEPIAVVPAKAKPRVATKRRPIGKKGVTPAGKALEVAPDDETLTAEEEAIFKPLPPAPPPPPPPSAHHPTPQPQWTKRYGRDPATPMAVLAIKPIKSTVRAFYGNLPKGGRMPSRIEIQEVLPLEVIEALNVPPESQLTMLGPFETNVTDGLKEILNLSEDNEGIFGVSVTTPNGEKHRDYIKTKP